MLHRGGWLADVEKTDLWSERLGGWPFIVNIFIFKESLKNNKQAKRNQAIKIGNRQKSVPVVQGCQNHFTSLNMAVLDPCL